MQDAEIGAMTRKKISLNHMKMYKCPVWGLHIYLKNG